MTSNFDFIRQPEATRMLKTTHQVAARIRYNDDEL